MDNNELSQGQHPPIIYIENMNEYLKIHYPNASLRLVTGTYRMSAWEKIIICIKNNLCCCICRDR
jgi:hypothetical protein